MGILRYAILLLFAFGSLNAELEKVHYRFSQEPIDVVIPCAPKDRETLPRCIEAIRTFGKDIRRIIVVSKEKLTDKAEWFAEKDYPFTKEDLAFEIFEHDAKMAKKFVSKKGSRIGWIYQQFLKLYAPFVIPDISSNVLILDADVVFIQPVEFMNQEGGPYFNVGGEYHRPYFKQMKRLLPDLKRIYPKYSGITHHMLFQKPILEDLFFLISNRHRTEPWKAICRTISLNHVDGSCFSEYEIYFNFALLRTDQAMIRPLPFLDVHPIGDIAQYQAEGYGYITSHERP